MSFPGFYALAFYTVIIGTLLLPAQKAEWPDLILTLVARSLLISWLVVVLSFWLNLPSLLVPLSGLTVAALVFRLGGQHRAMLSVGPVGQVVALGFVCAAPLAIAVAAGGFGEMYRPIFLGWDALVSWNRWAIELSQNEFSPYEAAYPVLLPGIWSLIYKAQGSADIWIIAKYTLILVPLLLLFPLAKLVLTDRIMAAALYGLFCFEFLIRTRLPDTFTGYMDMPVAIMVLLGSIWLYFSAIEIDERNSDKTITLSTACIICGLASIVKQAGILLLLPALYLIGVAALRRQMTGRVAALNVAFLIVPIGGFLTMFLWSGADPTGNLSGLQSLAQATAAERRQFVAAGFMLADVLPSYLLVMMIGLAVLNIFHIRRTSGQMGLIFLILGCIGFLVFADCCSYDVRNGWWVLAFLGASAVSGVQGLELIRPSTIAGRHISFKLVPALILAFGAILAGAYVISRVETSDRLLARQVHHQSALIAPEIRDGIAAIDPLLGPTGRLIGVMQPIEWLPGFREKFRYCHHVDTQCVQTTIAEHPNSVVMISRHQPVYFYEGFRERFDDNHLIGEFGGYEFYGPYGAGEEPT